MNLTAQVARLAVKDNTLAELIQQEAAQTLASKAINGIAKIGKSQRRRRRRRAQRREDESTNTSTLSIRAMPNAYASVTTMGQPKMTIMQNGAFLQLTVSVPALSTARANYGAIDFNTDSRAYKVFEYPINMLRSDLWSVLTAKAITYKRFVVRDMRLEWTPSVSTLVQGRSAIRFDNDASASIPNSFDNFLQATTGKASNVANPYTFALGPGALSAGKELLYIAPDNGRGSQGETGDKAVRRQSSQGSILVAFEGVAQQDGTALSANTTFGQLFFSLNIELQQSINPDQEALEYTNPTINFDLTYPEIPEVFNAYWVQSADRSRLTYRGPDAMYDFDLSIEAEDPLPAIVASLKTPAGVDVVPASVFSGWVGVTTGIPPLNVAHTDGKVMLRFGDYLELGVLPAGAKLSVVLEQEPFPLLSAF